MSGCPFPYLGSLLSADHNLFSRVMLLGRTLILPVPEALYYWSWISSSLKLHNDIPYYAGGMYSLGYINLVVVLKYTTRWWALVSEMVHIPSKCLSSTGLQWCLESIPGGTGQKARGWPEWGACPTQGTHTPRAMPSNQRMAECPGKTCMPRGTNMKTPHSLSSGCVSDSTPRRREAVSVNSPRATLLPVVYFCPPIVMTVDSFW